MMHYYGYMGGYWLYGALFWAAVITLIVWLLMRTKPTVAHESPLDVAKMRLAKGELTRKQYEETVALLKRG